MRNGWRDCEIYNSSRSCGCVTGSLRACTAYTGSLRPGLGERSSPTGGVKPAVKWTYAPQIHNRSGSLARRHAVIALVGNMRLDHVKSSRPPGLRTLRISANTGIGWAR